MVRQGEGVILIFGGEGEPMRDYYLGGTGRAPCPGDVRRQLAAEWANKAASHDHHHRRDPRDHWRRRRSHHRSGIVDATMIGKAATYEDVGRVAVFAASDQARMMTAATLNISGGSVID